MTLVLTNYKQSFQKRFFKCLANRPKRIDMVVPYIGVVDPWHDIQAFALQVMGHGSQFFLITQPPRKASSNTISIESAYRISGMGGQVAFRVQPTLHSKIYQFSYPDGERVAFIGSANFSKGGFYENDEIVAFSKEKKYNTDVAREIKRLANYSIDFNKWYSKNHAKS